MAINTARNVTWLDDTHLQQITEPHDMATSKKVCEHDGDSACSNACNDRDHMMHAIIKCFRAIPRLSQLGFMHCIGFTSGQ